jgi:hypothetical protein
MTAAAKVPGTDVWGGARDGDYKYGVCLSAFECEQACMRGGGGIERQREKERGREGGRGRERGREGETGHAGR